MNYDVEMPPHVEDMARWLDDDKQVDPSNGERAYSERLNRPLIQALSVSLDFFLASR